MLDYSLHEAASSDQITNNGFVASSHAERHYYGDTNPAHNLAIPEHATRAPICFRREPSLHHGCGYQ